MEAKREIPTAVQLEAELKRAKYRREYRKLLRNTISSLIVVAAIAVFGLHAVFAGAACELPERA